MTALDIVDIDVDGALQETAAAVAARPHTRGQFLRRSAQVAGPAAVLLGLAPVAALAKTGANDRTILNFALALEYLQAAFYTQAERVGALHGALADQATVVGSHERAHVRAFQAVLGRAAIREPHFNFHGVTDAAGSFRSTAVAFEDLAVGAYKEQLPKIHSAEYLAAAIGIHSVEARHASWIRRLAGVVPAARAFDEPISNEQTVKIVNSTRFVTLHVPKTSSSGSPAFTG